ncbi:protein translocase subunit secF [Tahibacter aquaticus]|uniref:Protein-export membrane protein SecF n=1 Tax=Tahibacter aquaticus TaxID=520092 RepID=A0A4R6Z9B9_9GAMM|nr:protein translocase subunit SecF [Tahibacter aquaticus]TDR48508.1 protein translocase subunit secF [Tahibacter aquaticus]
MELFKSSTNFDFMAWRVPSLIISAILCVASLGIVFIHGLDYGLDFEGGALVEVKYKESAEIADIRASLEGAGFKNAVVQALGTTTEYAIRIKPHDGEGAAPAPAADAGKAAQSKEGEAAAKESEAAASESVAKAATDKIAKEVLAALQKNRADVSIKRSEFVGASVGEELRSQGLVAVLFVILGIMVYLWIRFEWRFAVAAVASEIHDTLITVGIFALTGREFDLPALAAVLSVVGYSINDKVVVFDRVREIFRASRKDVPYDVLNRSINSTMSRTIMTGLTTGLAVGTLYFVGGPALENFGLIMLIGIAVGTLSSVFFANPILLYLGVSKQDLMAMTKEDPELARRP